MEHHILKNDDKIFEIFTRHTVFIVGPSGVFLTVGCHNIGAIIERALIFVITGQCAAGVNEILQNTA